MQLIAAALRNSVGVFLLCLRGLGWHPAVPPQPDIPNAFDVVLLPPALDLNLHLNLTHCRGAC